MVEIPDELAAEALATLRELNGADAPERKTDLRRHRAADSILRLYQVQSRYPQEDIERRARQPKGSQAVRELASLTSEELLKLQAEMVAAEWKDD